MRRFAFILSLSVALPLWASLGGNAASVENDRRALSGGVANAADFRGYRVQEFTNGGLTIREYLAPNGTVFAVSWSGIQQPDLSYLLGEHFPDFQRAMQSAPRAPGRRSHIELKGPDLVVEKNGHMRSMRGKAYLPSQLPPGVTADAIR
jgi:hypothetical protein